MKVRWILALAASACSVDGVTPDAGLETRRRMITVGPIPATAPLKNVAVPVRFGGQFGDRDFEEFVARNGRNFLFRLPNGTVLPFDIEAWSFDGPVRIVWVVLPELEPAGATFEFYYGTGNTNLIPGNAWQGLADRVLHFEHLGHYFGPEIPDHAPKGGIWELDGGGMKLLEGVFGWAASLEQVPLLTTRQTRSDPGLGSFSQSFWFRQDAANGASDRGWFKGGSTGPGYQVTLGTGEWSVNVRDASGNAASATFGTEDELGALEYVHLVLVVDRESNNLRAYTDGVEVATTPLPDGFDSVSAPDIDPLIGDGASGDFDELRTYPSVLSAEWIAVDHALGRNPSLVTVGAAESATYPSAN